MELRTWEPSEGDVLEGTWDQGADDLNPLMTVPCIKTEDGTMYVVPDDPQLRQYIQAHGPMVGDHLKIQYDGDARPDHWIVTH
jgi:hypothetical protein